MRYQPQGLRRIDRRNSLGAKVIEHLPLDSKSGALVSGARIAYGPAGVTRGSPKGLGLRGQGNGARASVPLDLSKYGSITIAFWIYWDGYANDDALAMEVGATYGANNGLIVDPNCSSPAAFMFGTGGNGVTSGSNLATFPRPSAGAWHRIVLSIDRSAPVGAPGTVYVDGVLQVTSAFPGAIATTGNFGADTLHLLSRNETGLFGTGNLQDITFYRGALSPAEAAQDYANPWQIFEAPDDDEYLVAAAPTGMSASLTWTEADDTVSLSGLLINRVAAAWVEAGDAVALSAVITNGASAAWTEAGDTAATVGVVTDRGTLTWTEQDDVMVLAGTVASPPPPSTGNTVAVSWAEAGDVAAIITRITNRAVVAAVEQDDIWALAANAALPPVINVTVRFNVLPRDLRTKITHFSN